MPHNWKHNKARQTCEKCEKLSSRLHLDWLFWQLPSFAVGTFDIHRCLVVQEMIRQGHHPNHDYNDIVTKRKDYYRKIAFPFASGNATEDEEEAFYEPAVRSLTSLED